MDNIQIWLSLTPLKYLTKWHKRMSQEASRWFSQVSWWEKQAGEKQSVELGTLTWDNVIILLILPPISCPFTEIHICPVGIIWPFVPAVVIGTMSLDICESLDPWGIMSLEFIKGRDTEYLLKKAQFPVKPASPNSQILWALEQLLGWHDFNNSYTNCETQIEP